ncbi:hypothetical protein AKJ29_12605 [Aliiroseovarius crassostreae]|uniref:Uncharacterized protein n=1 Tax=Aliiroseovarius crassostreae TaxID=154981 RepID=A0A0P7IXM4_9RHOB|nr:hypothetical protein AKJ29_12605 [Aliiroseovarius crassostreae]
MFLILILGRLVILRLLPARLIACLARSSTSLLILFFAFLFGKSACFTGNRISRSHNLGINHLREKTPAENNRQCRWLCRQMKPIIFFSQKRT